MKSLWCLLGWYCSSVFIPSNASVCVVCVVCELPLLCLYSWRASECDSVAISAVIVLGVKSPTTIKSWRITRTKEQSIEEYERKSFRISELWQPGEESSSNSGVQLKDIQKADVLRKKRLSKIVWFDSSSATVLWKVLYCRLNKSGKPPFTGNCRPVWSIRFRGVWLLVIKAIYYPRIHCACVGCTEDSSKETWAFDRETICLLIVVFRIHVHDIKWPRMRSVYLVFGFWSSN